MGEEAGSHVAHANLAPSVVQDSLDAGGLPSMPPAISAIWTLEVRPADDWGRNWGRKVDFGIGGGTEGSLCVLKTVGQKI